MESWDNVLSAADVNDIFYEIFFLLFQSGFSESWINRHIKDSSDIKDVYVWAKHICFTAHYTYE